MSKGVICSPRTQNTEDTLSGFRNFTFNLSRISPTITIINCMFNNLKHAIMPKNKVWKNWKINYGHGLGTVVVWDLDSHCYKKKICNMCEHLVNEKLSNKVH